MSAESSFNQIVDPAASADALASTATGPEPSPSIAASATLTQAKVKNLTNELKSDAAAQPKTVLHRLMQADLKRAEIARPDFRIVIHNLDVTLEDVLRPQYWANVGDLLKQTVKSWPFPIVEVIWADASRYVRLMVIDADNTWAKVRVLDDRDLDGALHEANAIRAEVAQASDYEIKWISPTARFGVTRLSDKKRIKDKFGTKAEAQLFVDDLVKSLGR